MTTGDVLAFIDDDCVAPADWITSIASAFTSDEAADLLYGQLLPLQHLADDQQLTPSLPIEQPERIGRGGSSFRVFGMGANFAAQRDRIGELVHVDVKKLSES